MCLPGGKRPAWLIFSLADKVWIRTDRTVWTSVLTSKVASEWETRHGRCSVHVLRINKCCMAECIKSSVLPFPLSDGAGKRNGQCMRPEVLSSLGGFCLLSLTETKAAGETDMLLYCVCWANYWVQKNSGLAWHLDEESKQKTCHQRSAGTGAAHSSLLSVPPLKSNEFFRGEQICSKLPCKNNVLLFLKEVVIQEAVLPFTFFLISQLNLTF